MSNKSETLRLAQALNNRQECEDEAADELRRLHADAEESEALRERLSELLRNTAIALRGPEPELTRWSWHDLPELAAALKAQRDALLERADTLQRWYDQQLDRLAAVEAQRDALLEACRAMLTFIERHAPRGLQPEPGSPVAMARAAIKKAEEA